VHLNTGQGLANSEAPGTYEAGWSASNDGSIAPTNGNLACSSGGYSGTWTNAPGANENLPIDCMNWYEAYAFCIWDGGFLPSEAEWEAAGAGGAAEREYPWGSATPTSQYAIYGAAHASAVGTAAAGVGLYGQFDLDGNADEWVLDSYAPYVNPCTDCAYLSSALNRETRDSPYWVGSGALSPEARLPGLAPTSREPGLGFRCARTP
jgi:formylglycine-generating enzyme required for sulfatase activity